MIDLMDLVRSIAAEAARADENTNYPLPCTPGSPLLAIVRQACVERGFTASGVAVSGAPAAAREPFERLAKLHDWDLAHAHSDGVTRWLNPMTRDLYLAFLEGRAANVPEAAPRQVQAPAAWRRMAKRAWEYRASAPTDAMKCQGWLPLYDHAPVQPVAVPEGWRLVPAEQGDALNSAVQRAASELPDGYTITVEVERGYGGVSWRNPDGEQCDEYHSDILAEDVIDALADAKQDAAIGTCAWPSIASEAA